MSEDDRWERGAAKIKEVYAGDVVTPPKGAMAFSDLMLEQLFAEVWTRDALSMRDRRLLLLGAIAALGEGMTFGIQSKASLKNGELTPDQLRECLIFLTQYVGYPRAAGLLGVVEKAIQDAAASAKE
jgi:4-carboxymuconolactone decarboxylase